MPSQSHAKGKVYLVGAGPGDPGLITVKGREALRRADMVVYDHLVSTRLLEIAPPHAQRVYVGKKAGKHTMPQESINELLAAEAILGKTVVRLKGGDPFIFGRGGEECMFLHEMRIAYEVIPGISAMSAVPAYAGIPLTHRNVSTSFTVVTGHEKEGKEEFDVDWSVLAQLEGTLVIFMGVLKLDHICTHLMGYGRKPDTPVAVIRWGTVPEQKTVVGTLADIAQTIEDMRLRPPGLIVIGEVVSLREYLNWFESRPLFGLRIGIPRTHSRPSKIVIMLEEKGADVMEVPVQRGQEWFSAELFQQFIHTVSEYRWVILTEPDCVSILFQKLIEQGADIRSLAHLKFAALGEETAAELRQVGVQPDFSSTQTCSPPLVRELQLNASLAGQKVMLLYEEEKPEALAEALKKAEAQADLLCLREKDENIPLPLYPNLHFDLILFLSSQSVVQFVEELEANQAQSVLLEARIASIGPKTVRTLERMNLPVHIAPTEPNLPALVEAIVAFSANERETG